MGTDIENINRKEISDLKSDKSDTEKIDNIEISDEVIMIDRKKVFDHDQVNNDTGKVSSEEEPEGKDQT